MGKRAFYSGKQLQQLFASVGCADAQLPLAGHETWVAFPDGTSWGVRPASPAPGGQVQDLFLLGHFKAGEELTLLEPEDPGAAGSAQAAPVAPPRANSQR